jgi:hypothetical protein
MKLLTAEVITKLPRLYSQEAVTDPLVRVKFFQPWGSWTWYVLEGDPVNEDGETIDLTAHPEADPADWLFFGLVDGFEEELGYFSLSELQSVEGPGGLRIERDRFWTPQPLSAVKGRRS